MRSAAIVVLLLAAPAALGQSEDSARQVLDACIESIRPEVIGLEDMEEACPGLEDAIAALGIAPLLPENQHDLLTRDGLINLRKLLDRYRQPPGREQVGVDSVQSVLESLREPAEVERSQSWYERFKRWLRETLDGKEQQANPWLRRWLDEHPVSEAVRLALFYGVMSLVVLLAILIVVNEVRAARTGRRKSKSVTPNAAGELAQSVPNVGSAAGADRLSAVLRKLIATLLETGRLQVAHSLTHRELMARARFDDSTQRESFQRVAQLAEREVFSGQALADDEVVDAIRLGRALDAQLNGAAI